MDEGVRREVSGFSLILCFSSPHQPTESEAEAEEEEEEEEEEEGEEEEEEKDKSDTDEIYEAMKMMIKII